MADRAELPSDAAAFDVKAAAAYIGMGVTWLANSDVPKVRLGRRVVYLRTDLDAYLAQRRDMDVAS